MELTQKFVYLAWIDPYISFGRCQNIIILKHVGFITIAIETSNTAQTTD